MTITTLSPLFTTPDQLMIDLQTQGYAVIDPSGICELTQSEIVELDALKPRWNDLPLDDYLRDGGRYRRRRHSCFVVNGSEVRQTPHRAHRQPLQYNALHGGMKRISEPIAPATVKPAVWSKLLWAAGNVCSKVKSKQPWYVEAHQFRIDTTDGVGRPTAEGAHRDGVDFVAILLVERTPFGPAASNTLLSPPMMFVLLLDDERVIHESTPIQPTAEGGYRDTLVLTYRADGFQEQAF